MGLDGLTGQGLVSQGSNLLRFLSRGACNFLRQMESVGWKQAECMPKQVQVYLASPFPHFQGQPVVSRFDLPSILSDLVSVLKKQIHAFGKGPSHFIDSS